MVFRNLTGHGWRLFQKGVLGYILLAPVFFLLHNNNELFGFIPLPYLVVFGMYIYFFTAMVFGITWRVTRSVQKAAFITCCCQVFGLGWGAWHDFIKSAVGRSFFSQYLVVLPASILFFTLCTWYVFKTPQRLQKMTAYLNIVFPVLCVLELVNAVGIYRQFKNDHNLIYPQQPLCSQYSSCDQPVTSKPDIYFLIFDEYTNNRNLRRYWNYNNGSITNWLSEQGFYCADSSRANYNFTPFSLSSVFNMNYPSIKLRDKNDLPVYSLKAVKSMSNNETFCILKKEQYDIHFISPFVNTFETLDVNREFDAYAEKKLFGQTFPGRFLQDFFWLFKNNDVNPDMLGKPDPFSANKERESRLFIEKIKSTANDRPNRPPQFVYGHLMTTHRPHAYDSIGAVRTAEDVRSNIPVFDTYVYQVEKANQQIRELVDHIQTHNRSNTIIIILGDHGFRQFPDPGNRDYFPNFSAFYFPDRNYPATLSNISAVNTFRIVFNQYFCQNLSLLKDSSIIVKY